MSRSIPMLGEVALDAVQRVRHVIDPGFVHLPVAGLNGDLVQAHGRRSHLVELEGLLVGDTAKADLETLQGLANAGEEQTFTADILTALELQKVVVTAFTAVEVAGTPQRYAYRLSLAESPPLPPPAQLSSFGGLDGFGLGDLGFDTDILGDIMDQANAVAAAAEQALDAVDQLAALAGAVDGLSVGDPTEALRGEVDKLAQPAQAAAGAVSALVTALFGGG